MDLTDLKQIERKLNESQRLVQGIIDTAMDAIISVDEDRRIVLFNAAAGKMFRCPAGEAIGSPIDRFIPKRFQAIHQRHLRDFGETGATSRTMGALGIVSGIRADGEEFPIEATISKIGAEGRRLFTVILRDITERIRTEEALSRLGQRLIQAQEEERTRIARELHDDISQRLALLAIDLDVLKRQVPAGAAELTNVIEAVRKQAEDLVRDIHCLSRGLHSTRLDYMGLPSAAAGLIREISGRQGVEIDFDSEGVPTDLSNEISLCLFRVLQESLQNAVKHSGSRHFRVTLAGSPDEVRLMVRDAGRGFDPAAVEGRGLGLISMKERLKLVEGDLCIESRLNHGTLVYARVPLLNKVNSSV